MSNPLIENFAIVACCVLTWALAQEWAVQRARPLAGVVLGGLMGLAAASTLILRLSIDPAVVAYATPVVTIALAATCGGLIGGAVACLVTSLVWLLGLAFAPADGIAVSLGLIAGLVAYGLHRQHVPKPVVVLAFGILVGVAQAASVSAQAPLVGAAGLPADVLPSAFVTAVEALLVAAFVAHRKHRAQTRALLLSAIKQAPEFMYVKDVDGNIVAANGNLARVIGFESADEIIGKTDYDLSDPARAEEFRVEEKRVMESGVPLRNKLETMYHPDGMHTYLTSKSAVRLPDGEVVGIVGVTRDISDLRTKERAIEESRDRMAFVLEEMSDGVALIDHHGNYVLSNACYRAFFPRTGHLRVAGASFKHVLSEVIRTGEQPVVVEGDTRAWIEEVMAEVREGGDEIVQLFDGRWLHKRIRSHPSGISTVVVSDITAAKQTEINLLAKTRKLEVLASTDGLTHITNRRGFDDVLEREVARSRRSRAPLSVVLLDVDHFKAYNDRYGHQAGDDCLRDIAKAIRSELKRPADLVARYGGEEFALILPDTNEAGARVVAECLRRAIADLARPHEDSVSGILSASMGIASMAGLDSELSPRTLFGRADEALYLAKRSGRNCIRTWSPDSERELPQVANL